MNRIFGPQNGRFNVRPNPDASKDEMRAKTAAQSSARFHKFMMDKLTKMVPERRRRLARAVLPQRMNLILAWCCSNFPPPRMIAWALSPGHIHPVYRMALLIPVTLIGSFFRAIVSAPLLKIQSIIWLWGIRRDIKAVDENTTEMRIWTKDESFTYRQDWRIGIISEVRADGTQKQVG